LFSFLSRPDLKNLKTISFTGGEPFLRNDLCELCRAVWKINPAIRIYISTNGTPEAQIFEFLNRVDDISNLKVTVSVDGIAKQDVQRGSPGVFSVVDATIKRIIKTYPALEMNVKYTVTPVNYDEVWETYQYFKKMRITLLVKLIENNKNYTNKYRYQENRKDFIFSEAQTGNLLRQILLIKNDCSIFNFSLRSYYSDVIEKLNNRPFKRARCLIPRSSLFVDTDLNVFTCKEYAPVINLKANKITDIFKSRLYNEIYKNEQNNTGYCRNCTSVMVQSSRTLRIFKI
jgi:MoaA/NifB/PqqE/SkfB family radical SAM enzyme